MDTSLHLTQDTRRTITIDGEEVPIREWELRSLLTVREFLPLFEYTAPGNPQPRRIVCPLFQYDPFKKLIVGEEGMETTLDERMFSVIRTTRQAGFDVFASDKIREVEQYVHIHVLLAGYEGHIMSCIPFFDTMKWHCMVRSTIVPSNEILFERKSAL